jgi:hypothetical protein
MNYNKKYDLSNASKRWQKKAGGAMSLEPRVNDQLT